MTLTQGALDVEVGDESSEDERLVARAHLLLAQHTAERITAGQVLAGLAQLLGKD